ncbi:MAG: hypothetical protein ACKOC8_01640 [Pirellulales bacterium]
MPSFKKATTKISGSSSETLGHRLAGATGLTMLAIWTAAAFAAKQPGPQPDKVAAFMRAKLVHSQDVLEGLTTESFELIDKGAQELSLVSQDASWQVLQTEDYARQSADFRRSCDRLRQAAQARNLDGAALAWMEVTMKCVQCHTYVRDEQRRDD